MDSLTHPLTTSTVALGSSVAFDLTNPSDNMLLDIIGKIIVPALLGIAHIWFANKKKK